jgi:ABC-type sugar transport system permease subunit
MERVGIVKREKLWWVPWAFLALPLLMYLIWVIGPILVSLYYSLTFKDSIFYPKGVRVVWLRNFARLVSDPQFYLALKNNLIWLAIFVIVPVPLGLFIAMLFNLEYKGSRLYKTLFYLPMTLSFAVIGTIWAWIYHPDFGALNTFLRLLGLERLGSTPWIGDKRFMTFALVFVGVWRQVPYVMILYLAGLKGVPVELVEAAMIDGTSWGQRFRHVVIPLLAPATIVAVTISIIDSLRAFDIIYVMTNTKARAAEVLATYMYSSAFHYQDFGYGSAIAVVQFLITLGFILVYVSNVLKNELQS